jgi:histidinol-phosphate aminotransferase
MQISRRNFLRTSTVGAAAGIAASSFSFPRLASAEPQRSLQPGGPILLNSNENPYGPWPSVLESMRGALSYANRYPDHHYNQLVNTIGQMHRVSPEQVIPGCGSTDVLRVTAELFCKPGQTLVTAMPTFEALGDYVSARGGKVRTVPLNANFEHDLPRMGAQASENVGLVYICNPNNPTANITPRRDIEAFLKTLRPKTYVLIDEAYHHFAMTAPDYASFIDQPVDNPRVIVARTFSKIYGLAGMRLGYAVAAPSVAKQMREFAAQDNVNMVAAQCGVAGLQDVAGLAAAVKRIATDRDDFTRQAQRREMKVIPSQANFAMMETGKPVRELIAYFKKNNVLIGRPFHGMESYARISFGTPEQMKIFWQTWDKMPS